MSSYGHAKLEVYTVTKLFSVNQKQRQTCISVRIWSTFNIRLLQIYHFFTN